MRLWRPHLPARSPRDDASNALERQFAGAYREPMERCRRPSDCSALRGPQAEVGLYLAECPDDLRWLLDPTGTPLRKGVHSSGKSCENSVPRSASIVRKRPS
jgi:hypothetical protein